MDTCLLTLSSTGLEGVNVHHPLGQDTHTRNNNKLKNPVMRIQEADHGTLSRHLRGRHI